MNCMFIVLSVKNNRREFDNSKYSSEKKQRYYVIIIHYWFLFPISFSEIVNYVLLSFLIVPVQYCFFNTELAKNKLTTSDGSRGRSTAPNLSRFKLQTIQIIRLSHLQNQKFLR